MNTNDTKAVANVIIDDVFLAAHNKALGEANTKQEIADILALRDRRIFELGYLIGKRDANRQTVDAFRNLIGAEE